MKIIIPVLVGAIIGYCTNWLAIKMLFRPHYEKKFLGIRIPFTPGLIPKERERMAENIGEAVGVHLLSPETIIESLNNENAEKKARQWLEEKIHILKENNKSLKGLIIGFSEKTYYGLKTTIKNNITNIIIRKIRGEKFKSLVYKSIEEKIENVNVENLYAMINNKLKGLINELSQSSMVKDHIENTIKRKLEELTKEERKLSEIIPENIVNEIYNTIEENESHIGKAIRDNFKDPSIQEKIGDFLTDLILQHIPKLVLTFVSPDLISGKILQIIEKYVDNEETDQYIIMFIKTSLDRLLDCSVKDIIPNININKIDNMGEEIIKVLFSEENQSLVLDIVGKELRKLEGATKEYLLKYIDENIIEILDSEILERALSNSIEESLDEFMNRPVNSIIGKIGTNEIDNMYDFFKIIFHSFAKEELPEIIQLFNISKIVEDKINSFDVDFTEKLILDIAQKELKAITWLGALLGGIMGLLTPFLQLIY